jgi:hypothetical protein
MKRFTIFAVLVLAAVASRTVFAQPDPNGATPPPAGSDAPATAAGSDASQPQMTDAMRAEIAAEVKKALAEERRQKGFETSVDKERPKDPNADPLGDNDYLSGDSGFMDTRLDFTFVNENMLVKAGETVPNYPGWRFGQPNPSLGTMFFDNYDTRYSGYETMSHVTLYKNYRRGHLEVEGGLVMKMNDISALNSSPGTAIVGTNPVVLTDDGSYMLVSYWKDPTHADPTRISFTAFPNSADRFRLGFSYRLSWGGNDVYQNVLGTTNSALPGAKVQVDGQNYYAFIGMKSALVNDANIGGAQAAKLGVLGGAGVDLVDNMVRVEANGGYFDRGPNQQPAVSTQEVQMFGGSAQVALHHGMPVTSSLDYKLYKNDAERIGRVFQPVVYKPGVSWLVMTEGEIIGQTLADPVKVGSTKIQWAKAGDINARVMMDRWRFRADASFRDLAYVVQNQPSEPSYQDFDPTFQISSDIFADIGVDHNWNDRVTLGMVFGVDRPAAITAPSGLPSNIAGSPGTGSETEVIRNNGFGNVISILPTGFKPEAAIAVKGTAQVNFGAVYAFLVNVYYQYDPNMTVGTENTMTNEFEFKFDHLNQLGMDLTLQAKF